MTGWELAKCGEALAESWGIGVRMDLRMSSSGRWVGGGHSIRPHSIAAVNLEVVGILGIEGVAGWLGHLFDR
jgi:hypothetical protein